ncbi:MAG TPA: hypothetical protein VLA95_05275 [Gemmatimonadales bacterium]|jgi:hypothetical protein|nr:hypothetical protein [Gemmatimonadales bacterium]
MSTLAVRVMVPDVWDEVPIELPGSATVAELKRTALDRLRVRRDPAGYEVKFRGAALHDENRSLTDAGVVPNANLIVLPRRRRPVK